MTVHVLKCWPEYFKATRDGTKKFELREEDRDFQVGDILKLREWLPDQKRYTGEEIYLKVTYIMHQTHTWLGGIGKCIMSVAEVRVELGGGMTIDPTEREEQKALFAWCKEMEIKYPELALAYACTNQGGIGAGGSSARRTAMVAGQKKGIPDICLPVARKGYHGMYIELKQRKGGKVTPDQYVWLEKLNEQGYKAVIAKGADEAIEIILDYMEGGHG